MMFEELLAEYEAVEEMYLRKDRKAVAAVAPDREHIGFLVIEPKSRKSFRGQGIVLASDVAEHVAKSGTRVYAPFDSPSWFNVGYYLQPSIDDKVICITPDHIAAHVKAAESDPNLVYDYLNEFSRIPCEAYAIDTCANKVRNTLATWNLQYNPFKKELRKQLRAELDLQIPKMVHDLHLCGIFDESDAILEARIRKQLLCRRFEVTCNVADFHTSNTFYELVNGAQHIHQYDYHKKINC